MKKYKIEYHNYFPYEPYYLVLTCDIGLAAALGSMGYTVLVDRKVNEYFPVFNIVSRVFPDLPIEKTERNINKYYLGHYMVDAYLLASNIEILSNIVHGTLKHSYNNEMPLKKSSILTNEQDIKEIQEEEEPTEEQLRDFYNEHAEEFFDFDISDIIDDEDIPF